jgi:bacteriorhodopsin
MSEYNTEKKEIPSPVISNTLPLVPRPPDNVAETANTISPTKLKDKIENTANPVQYYVKASFMITYILLLTTATITFIEAMRTKVPNIRHILNLETCISIVAGYFYSIFITQIDGFSKDNKPVDWTDITKTRYVDWSITTPMMLLTLCIVLGSNINKKVDLTTLSIIFILNYIMLYIGYLGETNAINLTGTREMNMLMASIIGFIPFTGMFYLIFKNFVLPKYNFANYSLYFFYLIVWSLYGVVYLFKEEYKNISMNILDSIAKCLIGLGLWAYFSHIITI